MRNHRGFTLIELLIAIAVVGTIVTLAAPSFFNFILNQRLKGISAQSLTDMQFARTEAAARNVPVRVRLNSNADVSCYVIYTGISGDCKCTSTPVCPSPAQLVRTVSIDKSLRVTITSPVAEEFSFDPTTGAMVVMASDFDEDTFPAFAIDVSIDEPRTLRTLIKLSGRPGVCAPVKSTLSAPACPAS